MVIVLFAVPSGVISGLGSMGGEINNLPLRICQFHVLIEGDFYSIGIKIRGKIFRPCLDVFRRSDINGATIWSLSWHNLLP